MSKKGLNKADNLSKEQEAKIPQYVEKYSAIALDTKRADRGRAEAAFIEIMKTLNLAAPTLIWFDSPFAAAEAVAKKSLNKDKVDAEDIKKIQNNVSHGSFGSYWVAFYDFVDKETSTEVHPIIEHAKVLTEEVGMYWTFEDGTVMVSEKPVEIHVKNDKLHNTDGMAIKFADGRGLFAIDGQIVPSLLEVVLNETMS